MERSSKRWSLLAALAAACLGLAVVGVAAGSDDPGLEQVALTKADSAFAKDVVLRRADLAGAKGWTGGLLSYPNIPYPTRCPTYLEFAPKESDIVVTGAATSRWTAAGVSIQVDTHILRAQAMAAAVWRRWAQPAYLGCLRDGATSDFNFGKVVSVKRVGFVQVGSFSAAYRVVVAQDGRKLLVDTILVAAGRARIQLHVVGPFEYRNDVGRFELGLARLLAGRALAHA